METGEIKLLTITEELAHISPLSVYHSIIKGFLDILCMFVDGLTVF